MSAADFDPIVRALFLIGAFAMAGGAQAVWLSSRRSRGIAWPLDGGRTFRGRRLLGDNKTVRGFVVMLPCTGAAFLMLVLAAPVQVRAALWPLSPAGYAALGVLAAIGCMLGELPNSFVKRQLDIAPGAAAPGRWLRPLFLVVDRIDSSVGALFALAAVVAVPSTTVLCVLVGGPLVHAGLSLLTFRLGGKTRPA